MLFLGLLTYSGVKLSTALCRLQRCWNHGMVIHGEAALLSSPSSMQEFGVVSMEQFCPPRLLSV